METKDYLTSMYTDFFETPLIDTNKAYEDKDISPIDEKEELVSKINELSISDESKEVLKRIIDYISRYSNKEETNYIPFRLIINGNNRNLASEVVDILYEASMYYKYIESDLRKEVSLYKLESEYIFNECGLVLIHSLNGLLNEEEKNTNKFLYELKEFLNNNSKTITIIYGTDDELKSFFLGREDIKNGYFDLVINGVNPDVQDIYNEIIEKVELSDDIKVNLLDYITNTYNSDIDYIKYKEDLIKYISFNKSIPVLEEKKSIDEIFKDLNELVGLEKVKKVLYDLVDVITLKEKTKDDLSIKDINLHMVFLGNPGTGKTTIARMISSILYNLKYIKENKLVEVSAKDLVAEYVGQTAPKTMSVVEKSMNGVLFIDEAYILASKGNDNSYNAEAIATLIQAMENFRDKFVVIFAGYTKEMQAFLDSNSGITSRIGYTLEFDDYTTDELIQIFLGMTKKSGFIVEDEAIKYLEGIIEENRNMENFGNARFIRNIFEKTVIKHASNVKNKKQKNILKTIVKNDISTDNLILKKDI